MIKKLLYRIFLTLVLGTLSCWVYAQEDFFNPELIKESDSLSKTMILKDISKIDSIGKIILHKKKYIDIAYFYKTKATYFQLNKVIDSSDHYYSMCLKYFSKIENKSDFVLSKLAIVHTNYSSVLSDLLEFEKAIDQNLAAIKIGKEIKDERRIAIAYLNIGNIFLDNKKHTKAIDNYKFAIGLFEKLDYKYGISACEQNMGLSYMELTKFDSASIYFGRSLEYLRKSNHHHTIAQVLGNLGLSQANAGDFRSSQKNIDASIELYKELDYQVGVNQGFLHLASLYFMSKRYKESLKILNSLEAVFLEEQNHPSVIALYSLQSKCYFALGELRKGLDKDGIKEDYKDSISIVTDVEKYIAYENKLNEQLQLEKQKAELAAEKVLLVEKNQFNNIIITIAIALIFLLGYTIFLTLKNKIRQKQLKIQLAKLQILRNRLERLQLSKEEKEVLIKEIHHRVKNNMQVIISLLRFQTYQIEDSKTKELIRECQTRIRSMSVIHEQLYKSENLATININQYITELINQLVESYEVNKKIRIDFNINVSCLGLDTLVPLGLIINEIISNSLKYAFENHDNPTITVALYKELDDTYTLNIGDNGQGLVNLNSWHESDTLGFDLIKTFSEQIEGKITLKHNDGLKYSINFKDIHHYENQIAV